jgi:hypothetical protein
MIIIQLLFSICSVSVPGGDTRGEGNAMRPDMFVLQVATR